MDEVESLQKSQNNKNQKLIYETIKQDIMGLANIKNKFNDVIRKNQLMNQKQLIKGEKSFFAKKNNIKNIALNTNHCKYNNSSFINLEKKIHKRFQKFYFTSIDFYNIKIINEIISNENSHIVAEFKDFLIKDDFSEFIQRFYIMEDSVFLLKQIFEYYKLSSVVYPNYILLPENKYIYRNIQKKQKIIDDQQEQEERNIDEEQKKKNLTERDKDKSEKVFDSKIIDSILNQSNTSQIQKCVFGVSNENSFEIEDNNNIYNLVKNIKKAEENIYNKNIEKYKSINNNNSLKTNKNSNKINSNIYKNNLNEEQSKLNNQIKKNMNKMKQFINNNNNINGNKIKTRNINIFTEFSNFAKTHSNLMPNFGNFRNVNKGRNIYSLYISKNPESQTSKRSNNKNKAKNGTNYINDKSINLTNENIKNTITLSKNKKLPNKYIKTNIESEGNKEEIDNFYKTDLKTYNNSIENNSVSSKNLKIIDKKNEKIGNIKKDFKLKKPPIPNMEFSKEELAQNNGKLIKKTIINELLSSLGTSFKETWKNSKLTESQKEFSNSINKTDRNRKSIKNLNLNDNYLKIRKKLNNTRNISDIIGDSYKYLNNNSKTMNTGKSNKQISLDIELINNKINIINNEQANSNTFENHNNKDSNLNINLTTERNTIAACRNEVRYQYNVKQFMNTKISNFKEKSLDKDINKEYKFNPITNKVKGRNKIIGKKNDSHNANSTANRKPICNKNSRNKSNNLYNNNITYAMINMKKYINNNSMYVNDKNSNNKKTSKNNKINQHETISVIPTSLKDKLKLNFDFLKQSEINQTENYSKKIQPPNRDFFLTSKNSQNIHRELNKNTNKHNKNNSILIQNQKPNEYPLSARVHKVNGHRSCNNHNNKNIDNMNNKYYGIFKNSKKIKNKGLKNSLIEPHIGNILFGYSNSYKNKSRYIQKIQHSNANNQKQNLILSNIINKKEDENFKPIKNNTISQENSRQKKRKKISSHIYSNSNCNRADLNSLLNNNYNTISNKPRSRSKNSHHHNINQDININEEKNKLKNNLMGSPNKISKIPKNINSNKKKDNNNINKEKFIIPIKSLNDKNERYYNIEVNINDINEKSKDNKDKFSAGKLNKDNNNKQHIKLNSTTQFSTGSLNINFNNYTNNYCLNYNNNSLVTTNQNKPKFTKMEPKNYKRIKNMKNDIKGFQINGFDKIIKNKKNNFFPMTLTDRNKQTNMDYHK